MRGWAIVALAACGRVDFDPLVLPDADPQCASELVELPRWNTPVRIAALSGTSSDDDPCPSDDGLELFFTANRSDTVGEADIYRATRASTSDPWGAIEHVVELASTVRENTPALSADALTMWFASDRPGGAGDDDIWVTTRADRSSPWTTPRAIPELATSFIDRAPSLFDHELAMVFHSTRPGGPGDQDFWITHRATLTSPWDPPVPLGPPNSPDAEYRGWISPCGLELDYQASRGQTSGPDFYVVRRATVDEPFGPEQEITELSSTAYDQDLRLSPDRRHAYFSSRRDGDDDLYEAVR